VKQDILEVDGSKMERKKERFVSIGGILILVAAILKCVIGEI